MYILLNSFDSTNDKINLTLTSISDSLSIVDWFNHNHKKRNSLDTPATFIELLKYVENSRVVVYWGDGSFTMASKSVELLARGDIEGILAVIDNDILAEPNDLKTEFASTVPKIQDINSESCFLCQTSRKTIKKED